MVYSICFIICMFSLTIVNCAQKDPPVPLSVLGMCSDVTFDTQECQHYFPLQNLKNFQSDRYKVHVKFYVMASYDATIILRDSIKYPKVEYKAVVGERMNTLNYLQKTNGTNYPDDRNNIQGILHPLWPVPIVITQSICGDLAISVPNVAEPLLTLPAADLELNFICVFAWNHASRWFYNCEEEDLLSHQTVDCTQSKPKKKKINILARV